MPLRDHFRPPVSRRSSWEGFHAMWPATMVQHLSRLLPEDYTAEPRVRLGTSFEINIGAMGDTGNHHPYGAPGNGSGGTATLTKTATYAPPEPTWVTEADIPEEYEYEVLIHDQSRNRQLVAAIEIVSPANKDRPESRRSFVAKCAGLLKKGVCVSIVDLVTVRQFNLYAELLELMDRPDPAFAKERSPLYATTSRGLNLGPNCRLESWAYPMQIGEPLPSLPIWLDEGLAVPLELELGYEETCRVLRIP